MRPQFPFVSIPSFLKHGLATATFVLATMPTLTLSEPLPTNDLHKLKAPAPELRIVQAQHQHGGHGNHGAAHGTGTATTSGTAAQTASPGADRIYKAGDLVITAPWARATPGGAKVAGGYLAITNTGKEPETFKGGSASFAGRLEVHEMATTDGIMRMRELSAGLTIAPGQTVELKPGGVHVMFMDLKQPLKEGQTFKGTLTFARAGNVDIEFKVGGIAARSDASGGDSGGHKH